MVNSRKTIKEKAFALIVALDDSAYASKITKSRWAFYSISLILLLIIQESLFNQWRILGIKPNIALALVFSIATVIDVRPSLFLGFFSGLYIDIVYGRYFGLCALTLMLFASFVSAISAHRSRNRFLWLSSFMVPAFLAYTMFESLCVRLVAVSRSGQIELYTHYGFHLIKRIIPVSLYTSFILLIIVLPVRLAWSKLGPKYKIF